MGRADAAEARATVAVAAAETEAEEEEEEGEQVEEKGFEVGNAAVVSAVTDMK